MKRVRKFWPKDVLERWKSFRGYSEWKVPEPDPVFADKARNEIEQANYRAVELLTTNRDILSDQSEKEGSKLKTTLSPDIANLQHSSFSRADFYNALNRATRKVA